MFFALSFAVTAQAGVHAQEASPQTARIPQHVRIEARLGYGASTTVVRDEIATATLTTKFNIKVEPATAKFKPSPEIGVAIVLPLQPGTGAAVSASWSPSWVRADEGGVARDVQSVSIVQAMLSVRHAFGTLIEAGGGIGGTHFIASDEALLRGSSWFSPVAEGTLGAGRNVGAHRLHIAAVAQFERFTTQSITDAGGDPGNVMRYAVRASWTWKGATQ